MVVTINQPQRVGTNTWRVTWASTFSTPVFRIFRDGIFIALTTTTEWDFVVATGEVPVIEILEDDGTSPQLSFPGRLTLSWRRVSDAASYRIEEFIGAQFEPVAIIPDDGRGHLTFDTRFLEDETSHQFQIVPIGTNGNDGTPVAFTALMVRHPDPPEVVYTYNPTDQKVTISAA